MSNRKNNEDVTLQITEIIRAAVIQHGPKGFSTGELIGGVLTFLNLIIQLLEKKGDETLAMRQEIAEQMLKIMPTLGPKQ